VTRLKLNQGCSELSDSTEQSVLCNKSKVEKFEQRRAELEKAAAAKYQESLARQQTIQALAVITLSAKSGDEGKLSAQLGHVILQMRLPKQA